MDNEKKYSDDSTGNVTHGVAFHQNRATKKYLQSSMVATMMTSHARMRMDSRRIPMAAIDAALGVGRVFHTRGSAIYAIGRKEVKQYRKQGVDLSDYEGVQVLCSADGKILTVYRNRDFSGLRHRDRKYSGYMSAA